MPRYCAVLLGVQFSFSTGSSGSDSSLGRAWTDESPEHIFDTSPVGREGRKKPCTPRCTRKSCAEARLATGGRVEPRPAQRVPPWPRNAPTPGTWTSRNERRLRLYDPLLDRVQMCRQGTKRYAP